MDAQNIESIYELSPMQQGMLFHSLRSPDSGIYVEQLSCALRGKLNASALERAWQRVMDRHSVLRTSFYWKELDKPLQLVQRKVSLPFEHHDWQRLTEDEQRKRLDQLLEEDRRRGFTLSEAPLMRLALICTGEDSYQFIWSHHHLLLDGWSTSLLLGEVFAFYDAFDAGKELQLSAPRPFRDYIAWIHGQDLLTAESYWREQLRGFTSPTPLPAAAKTSGIKSDMAESLNLSAEVTDLLQTFIRKHELTLNTLAQGAWALLLSRYSGEQDLVFGATVSGRQANLAGIETMIGLLINTLPVRVRVRSDDRLLDWLKSLQQRQAEQREYEYSPLAQVQTWSEVPHGTPTFETIVVFENYPIDSSSLSRATGLQITDVRSFEKTNYPMTLVIKPGREMLLEIKYDGKRVVAGVMRQMLRYLASLMQSMATEQGPRLRDLAILEPPEQEVVNGWNRASAVYSTGRCLHELFERQAERSPDQTAVVADHNRLTYSQLNRRANQLAHHLSARGVGADTVVGICLERSAQMVVAVLGVLKAGGAYVPLDPAYPPRRLALMIDDAGIEIIVTEQYLVSSLPLPISAQLDLVKMDADTEAIAQHSDENLSAIIAADNLAYVIYTSGSTGKPKGVMVSHHNVARLLVATEPCFRFNEKDVWTLFHSFAFDFSVWEIWGALAYGGRLVIVPYRLSRSPQEFLQMVRREGVTVLNQTPSAFYQLIAADQELAATAQSSEKALALRLVIFGGEALNPVKLHKWVNQYGARQPQLINMYGITETTVHVTYKALSESDVIGDGARLIGGPIPDLQLYILDRFLEPQPIGAIGEMYIGGAGLARGYLNRQDLTAERFIPDPFSRKAGARLYRTGDLARRLPADDIEYLGRIDDQVKIRGFRIELGEIEALLGKHPSVRETAVLAKEYSPDDQRLVAYVVFHPKRAENINRLREFLRERLPDYMVPAAIVPIENLPLNANGKLDRRALPPPEQVVIDLESEMVSPRDAVEAQLVSIFAQVLGRERISIDDSFFDLGGDSIRSIQVRALALKAGLDVSIQQLFDHASVRALARVLRSSGRGVSLPSGTSEYSLIPDDDRRRLPETAEEAYPLTMLQEGMLFHSSYSNETPTYHDIFSFHLKTAFDENALRKAAQKLAARHPVLRTSFDLNSFSQPLQIVHRAANIPFTVEDLRHLPDSEQEMALSDWMNAEKNSRFDWSRVPLLRLCAHRRSDETFQFTISFHHAILDGWSLASMLAELFHLYFPLRDEGAVIDEPPLRSSFRNFVAMERAALESDDARRYWNQKLEGLSFTALPRWPAENGAWGTRQVRALETPIPAEVFEALKRLARQASVPIKSVLLAAHLRVIGLLGGQSDVVTGVVSNGRPEDDDGERVLGLFLNTLPFRLRLGGGRWIDLAEQTFEAEREAIPFRRFPMAKLQQNFGGQPLFETAFNFTHFHVYGSLERLNHIEVLGVNTFEQTNFVLLTNFSLDLSSSRLLLSLEYDCAELRNDQAEAIGQYYSNALRAMAEEPLANYASYPLIPAKERHQLLVEWNHTKKESATGQLLHHMFEQQVAHTPDRTAILFGKTRLTYNELNLCANRLARRLRNLGVGPDAVVGVFMGRSAEAIVALLGVLKAGAAYVPLDPEYPPERLSFIIEDACPAAILTEKQFIENLPRTSVKVICVDADWDLMACEKADNLINWTYSDNLAYVIYTSGSTGRPKGAQLSHGALANLIAWQVQRSQLGPCARTLQFTSLSFDVSFQEIFSTLCSGGILVLVSEHTRRDVKALLDYLVDEKIDRLFLPFVALQQLSAAAKSHDLLPSNLSEVITAGEQLQITPPIANLFKKLKGCLLENQYGPTESHVVTAFALSGSPDDWPALPQIGRPISNAKIYILDAALQPAPIGVAGEIYIGGDVIGRGYHKCPDLTAERFIPDGFADRPGSRLYKTGDLGRFLPQGDIEFLGRNDYQVKIRGYRVELGEIETALAEHREVRKAVVVATGETTGDRRLVAYIICNPKSRDIVADLHRFLKDRLPNYMLPSVFIVIDELPLTPSGKIDRRALPAPSGAKQSLEENYVAPATVTEERLAGIWAVVLKLGQVGTSSNFFDLGGHSLLATQVMSRVREAFGIELPLIRLFESPTVSEFAAVIDQCIDESKKISSKRVELLSERQTLLEKLAELEMLLKEEGAATPQVNKSEITTEPEQVTIQPAPSTAPALSKAQTIRSQNRRAVPLSFAQQRLWFIQQLDPDNPAYNIPTALRLKGLLNVGALERGINEIINRHESLRTTFALIDQGPVQVIAPELRLSLPVMKLDHLPEGEREREATRLASEDARRPFDLAWGPLIRAKLLRLDPQDYVLLVSMHHIVSDGWSMGVLVQEMKLLYESFANGQPSPLPPLNTQYADFAERQREWLRGERLEQQLSYWKKQLDGAPGLMNLPTDRPRPARRSFRGSSEYIHLERSLSNELKRLSQREGATLFMTLLAAFQALLCRYTGQDDIVVGAPIASRNRQEIEQLIGFFVNSLALRTDLSGDPTFRELLARVRSVTLGAYAHQDLPFEAIVDHLKLERSLSYNPVFQAVFSMGNTPSVSLDLAGLTITEIDLGMETEKFDLTLRMAEAGQGIDASLGYNEDIFEKATVKRMLGYLRNLLEAIAENPDQRISRLTLLDEHERRQLYAWGQSSSIVSPRSQLLHQLFEAQAEKTPNHIALTDEAEQLTYDELNRRANRLAHYLIRLGVAPDIVVGILAERGVDMLISMLAILKAGGAYVPLDPAYPKARIALMLEDAKVDLLLTEQYLAERFDSSGLRPLCLTLERERISRESDENPTSRVTADNVAYVIYTSGSTGKPKGVMVSHHNVARLLVATEPCFRFHEKDVWTLFHSFAFDFSVWEIWGALAYGGRLVIVPYRLSRSPQEFLQMVRREGVTVLNQTPSAFYQLIAADQELAATAQSSEKALALRLVIFGGEALDLQRLKAWFERPSDSPRLVNMYGITETTVHVTYRLIAARDTIELTASPVGGPLADLEAYVLDSHMQLVPIGVAGELYVGGEGLARGYLNRPDLTAERFVPNPFSQRPGARLYRSGDLVRFLASGELDYLGRIDRQVKVRGFRIELGEIEAALMSYNAVREAVVLLREDAPGSKQLVAYLVVKQASAASVDNLRSFLCERLPEHMVPAAFVILDEMPLTRNGKLDHRALPAPGSARPHLQKSHMAPRNKLEELLATTWAQVLRLDEVGIEDDFFALGGDSIKGAILINELQAKLGEVIHVVAIFSAPTIAQLAVYLADNYPDSVSKFLGEASAQNLQRGEVSLSLIEGAKIDSSKVAQMRRLIKPLAPRLKGPAVKNPPAIFVLSAPRSGSTLLRVMLAGHPLLFSPPELELLSFNTLKERKAAFTGRDSFWLEGAVRAVMEVESCNAQRAAAIMERYEEAGLTAQQFYNLLQGWLGNQCLVDKTPSYALDRRILERAEEDFEGAMYIHLLRHPCGMIRSFEEYRLEQIFFRYEHSFSRRELAELIWVVSNENILEFLEGIPQRRKYQLRYEELLEQPKQVMERLSEFLGLELDAGMLQPYENKRKKMTDGIHAESRMLGDVKFHTHKAIDPRVGEKWKGAIAESSLGKPTRRLAEALGYELRPVVKPPLLAIRAGNGKPPFFCVHPVGGGAVQYGHLARYLGPDQPFYGLEGLAPDEPYVEIRERAARYIEALREVEPAGPYLLGGWSFGGLVAFEMAQQLRDCGEEVALLALFDPMYPSFGKGADDGSFDSDDPVTIVEHISKISSWGSRLSYEYLKQLSRDEQLESIVEFGRTTPLLPPDIGPENVVDWLRGLREKLKSARRYVPRIYTGSITLFILDEAQYADSQEPQNTIDPVSRWSKLSTKPVEAYTVPGTHHTMVLEPNVRALAGHLRRCISEAVDKRFIQYPDEALCKE